MEKNFAEKQPNFFSRKVVLSKDMDSLQVLPQMPKHQVLYFLTQAYERRKPIILQTNKTKHVLTVQEQKGLLRYAPNQKKLLILENSDQQMTYMLSFDDIRHVRLA